MRPRGRPIRAKPEQSASTNTSSPHAERAPLNSVGLLRKRKYVFRSFRSAQDSIDGNDARSDYNPNIDAKIFRKRAKRTTSGIEKTTLKETQIREKVALKIRQFQAMMVRCPCGYLMRKSKPHNHFNIINVELQDWHKPL